MDKNDFLKALIAALLGLLPGIVSALITWLQKRSKGARREAAIELAQRRVAFLSAWLQARQQTESSRKISNIKKDVAKELDVIKSRVNEAMQITVEESQRGPRVFVSFVPYATLIRIIGFIAVAFPFVVSIGALFLGGIGIQSSIGGYYYTTMRPVFVGFIFSIGICLLFYQGYEPPDRIAGYLAGIFAIGYVIFPMPPSGQITGNALLIGNLHFMFFSLFFVTLSYFSLFLFTKTHPHRAPTKQKLRRNRVYRVCGYTMLICVFLIGAISALPITAFARWYQPVFWLQTIAFMAFGISFLTKSEWILADETGKKD